MSKWYHASDTDVCHREQQSKSGQQCYCAMLVWVQASVYLVLFILKFSKWPSKPIQIRHRSFVFLSVCILLNGSMRNKKASLVSGVGGSFMSLFFKFFYIYSSVQRLMDV